MDALTAEQIREIDARIKVGVHEYFDHYLLVVFPAQQKAAQERVQLLIEQHDAQKTAHGGVELKFRRLIWVLAGATLTGGGAGAGLMQLISG